MFASPQRKTCRCVLAAVAITAAFLRPAQAIDIVLNFDAANSTSPAFDPDGSRLMSMMDEAARKWEDIIEDTHTMNVDVIYDDDLPTADAGVVQFTTDGKRTIQGTIRFSDFRDWYFDPTPSSNSEFDFTQTLFRDGPASDFNTTGDGVPLLEVGYVGQQNGRDPNASLGFDALTTAIHELGHLLGVTNQTIGAQIETQDDDYDLPTSMTGGTAIAVRTKASDQRFHLLPGTPSLSGTGPAKGERRLASATDVLAAAASSGWTNIDLTRQDFLAGTNFNAPGGWVGGQVPGGADSAVVRHGGVANMSANAVVDTLVIDEDSSVSTQANRLVALRNVDVGPTGKAGLVVGGFSGGGTPALTARKLTVGDEARVSMFGTDALIDVDEMLIGTSGFGSDATLLGDGTVDVEGSFVNNGKISGGFLIGGHLTVTASGSNTLDVDGEFSQGEIEAAAGDLTIDGPLTDGLSSKAVVGKGRTLTFTQPWELFGTLKMTGDAAGGDQASLEGAQATIGGSVIADGSSNHIKAVTKFVPGANVDIPDADDQLTLGTDIYSTTLEAGEFRGDGKLQLAGNTFVRENATVNINVGELDWDGPGSSETRLLVGSTLNINVDSMTDPHSGPLRVYGGHLAVTTDSGKWELDGPLQVNVGNADLARISGSTLHVLDSGTVDFRDNSEVSAPLVVDGQIEFEDGVHRIDNLTVSEEGTVDFRSGHLIAGTIQQEIASDFNFDDGFLTFDTFSASSTAQPGTLTNTGGTLSPGDRIGTSTVQGNYTQNGGGMLAIEISGTTAGSDYDVLSVSNRAVLAGTLEVSLAAGFQPQVGDSFEILEFGQLVGQFSTLNLPALSTGLSWDDEYGTSALILSVLADFLAGDMNGDGQINFGDLSPFTVALTDPSSYEGMYPALDRVARCDVNVDGQCNFADLTPFGNLLTMGAGSGSATSQAVPEPTTAGLLLVMLLGVGLTARRAR